MIKRIKSLNSSIKNLWERLDLKPLLPYIIAVLSGVTTFFIYSFLNRDIVRVQSVSVRPKEIVLNFDRKAADKLSNLISDEVFSLSSSEIDLTTINKDYLLEVIDKLKRKSEKASDEIQKFNAAKSNIIDLKKDSFSKIDLEKLDILDILDIGIDNNNNFVFNNFFNHQLSEQELIGKIKEKVNNILKTKQEIDDVLKVIFQKIKIAVEDDKSQFEIEIIAFNEGNQQTVVRNKGSLTLGATQMNLKKSSSLKITNKFSGFSSTIYARGKNETSNYLIIEPKAFIVLNLEIDPFNNKSRDIEVIKREYLSGNSQVELTLFDIKNNPIKPFKFVFQNDIEYDPNDELLKDLKLYSNK